MRASVVAVLCAAAQALVSPASRATGRFRVIVAAEGASKLPPKRLPLAVAAVALSAAPFAACAARPRTLFAWHPLLATLALPLATLAVFAVRSRVSAAPRAAPGRRRGVLLERVQAHFLLTALAGVCLFGGVGAVATSKTLNARPHLASAHARGGAVAVALWAVALVAAELQVWKDGWPRVDFAGRRVVYEPRFLWSSKAHRNLGKAAYGALAASIASGLALTSYGSALKYHTLALAAVAAMVGAMAATWAPRANATKPPRREKAI
ncbi:hypothetical protein M885DRAFT_612845 [Pelagophyceae sp. CCMP2097]|nr:hypothetical protein M885DRAFT_612845 [Pelagophyceae sp. CCMP2097]